MHRRTQPVQLVRDGAGIHLTGPPWAPRLHTQRFPRQDTGWPQALLSQTRHQRANLVRRHDDVASSVELTGMAVGVVLAAQADVVACAAGDHAGPGVMPGGDPGPGLLSRGLQRRQTTGVGTEHRQLLTLAHLHRQHEAHRVQEVREHRSVSSLRDQEEGLAVIHRRQGVSNVPLRIQEQGLGSAVAGGQPGEDLAGQGGQPAEPIRPADGDDVPGQCHHGPSLSQERLLAQRVAKVGGDQEVRLPSRVRGIDSHGPVQVQQR